jgi:hypothetical protein
MRTGARRNRHVHRSVNRPATGAIGKTRRPSSPSSAGVHALRREQDSGHPAERDVLLAHKRASRRLAQGPVLPVGARPWGGSAVTGFARAASGLSGDSAPAPALPTLQRRSHDLGVVAGDGRFPPTGHGRPQSCACLPCPCEHECGCRPARREAPACRAWQGAIGVRQSPSAFVSVRGGVACPRRRDGPAGSRAGVGASIGSPAGTFGLAQSLAQR